MKELEFVKLEFLMTLNDNIVVQRFFNVKGFNPKAKSSMELYYYMKEIVETLHYDLKMKTVIYMIDNKEAIMHDPSVMETSFTEGPEVFNIYLKIGDQTICHRQFNGKLYPPKVRYTVDVRPYLKEILKTLTDILSDSDLTFEYLEYELTK
jgi:hypothetical protein